MKKIAVLLVLFLLLSLSWAFAEEKDDQNAKTFSITVYPVMAAYGWYSGEVELAFSKHFSLAFETKYTPDEDKLQIAGGDSNGKTMIFEYGPGLRFYPNRALDGFFVGLYANRTYVKDSYIDNKSLSQVHRYNGYSVAGWVGVKRLFYNLLYEASFGYGYQKEASRIQRII